MSKSWESLKQESFRNKNMFIFSRKKKNEMTVLERMLLAYLLFLVIFWVVWLKKFIIIRAKITFHAS